MKKIYNDCSVIDIYANMNPQEIKAVMKIIKLIKSVKRRI